MHKLRILALLAVILAAGGALTASPAGAKVAGVNGLIAFARYDPTLKDTVTYIANPDGTHLRLLFPGKPTALPHWSPNGRELALQTGLNNPCPPCAQTTIILNPDTRSYRMLLPPDPNLSTGCSLWSPDATRFACEVGSPDGSRNGVYTIRTSDGRGLKQITSNPGGRDVPIDYSPSGKQLVFGRLSQNQNGTCTKHDALYVVNLDGSGLHRVTPGGFCDDNGSWSPNGKEIAFVTDSGSIYVVHPDGTGLKKIVLATAAPAYAGDVTWSPDGKRIAFLFSRGPRARIREGIATANANGTNVRRITASPTFDHETDWGTHPLTGG